MKCKSKQKDLVQSKKIALAFKTLLRTSFEQSAIFVRNISLK